MVNKDEYIVSIKFQAKPQFSDSILFTFSLCRNMAEELATLNVVVVVVAVAATYFNVSRSTVCLLVFLKLPVTIIAGKLPVSYR